jgi:hypothetical protein
MTRPEEVIVKTCHIYPVSAGPGIYHWKWRLVDGKRKAASTKSFELFYDCVEDVRSHGGEVDLDHVHQDIANDNAHVKIVSQTRS